jgi:hypothetical protein
MLDFNLKKLLTNVRDSVAAKHNAINVATDKRKHLCTSMPPKIDVIEFFDGRVDQLAASYDAALKFSIDRLAGDPLNFSKTDGIGILSAYPPGSRASLESFEAAYLALHGDEVKRALRARIEAMPWPTPVGPRIADRPALIEKADRELAELGKDLADLRREAAESGVILS